MPKLAHEEGWGTNRAVSMPDLARFRAPLPIVDALRPPSSEQVVSCDEQIRQGAGDEGPAGVLGDAAVAHLGEAEHALDHADGVLDAGAYPAACPFDPAIVLAQVPVASAAPLREVARPRCSSLDLLGASDLGRVAPHVRLLAVQELLDHVAVRDVGRGPSQRVNELGLSVHAHVRLHMPKCQSLPFRVWCISGSRSPWAFLVELGAAMMVASTIVPEETFKPWR